MRVPPHLVVHQAWGRNVRLRRGRRTQAEVAGQAGIDQSTLSRVETGDYRALTPELILRLAAALEVEPAELCPWPSVGRRRASSVGRVA